ncbi:hypothetical protein N5P37_003048 [Trichoderma harzianum]|nr:hypothetical protein N5P37_003048 [Trichoderma harzianum]
MTFVFLQPYAKAICPDLNSGRQLFHPSHQKYGQDSVIHLKQQCLQDSGSLVHALRGHDSLFKAHSNVLCRPLAIQSFLVQAPNNDSGLFGKKLRATKEGIQTHSSARATSTLKFGGSVQILHQAYSRAFKAHGNVLRRPLGYTITVSNSPLPHNPRHSRGAHRITSILTSSMAVLSQWLQRVSDKAPAPKRKPSIGRKLHDEIMKSSLGLTGLTVMSYAGLWLSRVAYCDTTFIILEEHIKCNNASSPKRKPSMGRKLHDEIMKSFLGPIGLTQLIARLDEKKKAIFNVVDTYEKNGQDSVQHLKQQCLQDSDGPSNTSR